MNTQQNTNNARREYAIIETINLNYRLKELSKVRDDEAIEMELYGTHDECKQQMRQHINELKKEGLI